MTDRDKVTIFKWAVGGYVTLRVVHTVSVLVLAKQGLMYDVGVPVKPKSLAMPITKD